jgi:hypothetical protein
MFGTQSVILAHCFDFKPRFLATAMLYEERSPGRLRPSPSLVHHL